MALKELERLTRELEKMAELLKAETNPASRLVILQQVQEIMGSISRGLVHD